MIDDLVALLDLDGTVADYDEAMTEEQRALQGPNEEPYKGRYEEGVEPDHIYARRKLIQQMPGFWRNLNTIPYGFEIVREVGAIGFDLHVLTKGPSKTPSAWSEKLEWCAINLPDLPVTVTSEKSLVYGRVLVDDYPPYFEAWLKVRPRGLVVCVAQPWNAAYAEGGPLWRRNILRYEGTRADLATLRTLLKLAYHRAPGEMFETA